MFSLQSQRAFNNPLFKNTFYITLFGSLSGVLSLVGFDEVNLREIPLLICLIHLGNLSSVLALTLFIFINPPQGIPLWAVYVVHLLPLLAAWLSLKLVEKKKLHYIYLGVASIMITLGYYLLLLLPLVVATIQVFTPDGKGFVEAYLTFLPRSSFEIISSSLVVAFYLLQFDIRKTLEHNNKNLALVVKERTFELTTANSKLLSLNEELVASNNNITVLNENLERMVKERTDKINDQLNQLSKYIHMNSHELRAPLARMLGLMHLIKLENVDDDQKRELLDLLYQSSVELDTVIKEMNRLLEKERPTNLL